MFIRIANFAARWSLVQRFNVVGLVVMILGTVVIGNWVGEQIKSIVINESAATTALYLNSFIVPNLQELSHSKSLTPEHIEILNKQLTETNLGRRVVTVKVWDPSGLILYSNRPSLIGLSFPGASDLELVLQGKVVTGISNLQDDENFEERLIYTRLLEIYIPVRLNGTHQIIAIAEFYQTVDVLEAEIAAAQKQSWLVVITSMAVIYLLLAGFVQRTGNRIKQQETALKNQVMQLTEVLSQNNELNQRVRRATENAATLNERLLHRITVELTNGPAQEINLALSQLGGAIDENNVCRLVNLNSKCNENLPIVQTSLQTAMQEILAITGGLGLPQLEGLTLPETFTRVVRAHELRTGTKVDLSMTGLPDQAPLPIKTIAYRIVQESLNNAYRHAGGSGQNVYVLFSMNELQIEISDQGPGFDISQPVIVEEKRLGLAGMRERVESLGGLFLVESKINEGTKVITRLYLQSDEAVVNA